ncbi:YceI family protein [Oerskovia flava]|uniref:YceI family protein n=1 Tax=Oerskovia flava TaxID=2986422 RepID=UPI00223FF9F4|nr:YceI family protein [Oerskovia sp. JB1-3-2]
MSRGRTWIVVAVVLALAIVFGGPYVYARLSQGSAPAPLGLQTPGESVAPTAAPEPGPLDVEGFWTVAEGSAAGYRVDEVLSGQEATVVGRTQDVTGSMIVEDTQMRFAEVVVDVASLETDSGARDEYFQGLLETDIYPTAVFTLTDPVDLSELPDQREPVALEAAGALTIRDTTQPVTVALEAQRSGAGVQVSGAIPVRFADFGVSVPDLEFVRVSEEGTVEMLLNLEPTEALERGPAPTDDETPSGP